MINIVYVELDMTQHEVIFKGNIKELSELILNAEKIDNKYFIEIDKTYVPIHRITALHITKF